MDLPSSRAASLAARRGRPPCAREGEKGKESLMRLTFWRKAAAVLVSTAALALFGVAPAVADDQQILLELKARLDKLEKANAELQQKLDSKIVPASQPAVTIPGPYKAPEVPKEEINK